MIDERPIAKVVQYVYDHTTMVGKDVKDERVCYMHFFSVTGYNMPDSYDEFVDLTKAARRGEFSDMGEYEISQGPSYIAVGGWIGDQGLALRYMALGSLLKLWDIMTPASLNIEGETADKMAGQGYVMIMPTEETRKAFA